MGHDLESLVKQWGGEAVVWRYDAIVDAWIFIALHSSLRGQPTGGVRMKTYDSPADGLRDAMRLAEGMTNKRFTTISLTRSRSVEHQNRPNSRVMALRPYSIAPD